MRFLTSDIKYSIYVVNLLLLICGGLHIVLGAVMLASLGDFNGFSDIKETNTIPILVVAIGCLGLSFGIFGCFAANRESVCHILLYVTVVLILFFLELALLVWLFVYGDNFVDTMSEVVEQAWHNNDEQHGYPMDSLQLNFDCCGVKYYTDYTNEALNVPASCCGKLLAAQCTKDIYELRPGCADEFGDFWQWNINIIGYAGLALLVVEFVAFSLACMLLSGIRKSPKIR